jgi:3',5'-cyclic AMP phosphodiesterase CpdA
MNRLKIFSLPLIILSLILIPIASSSPFPDMFLTENNELSTSPSILVGPYTQYQTTTSIIVLWETSDTTQNNEVHWGLTPDCEHITLERIVIDQNLHKVTISGLEPSTQYYYKVKSDEVESTVYVFYTAFNKEDEIRFVAYGDSRGAWDNWVATESVSKAIEKEHPEFVLHTGDLVHNGTIQEEWLGCFSASGFIHNSTLYPVLGNHEQYGSPYFSYFVLPKNERWYSFDNGPVHFIGLDSNYRSAIKIRQTIWFILDLLKNTQPFTIVFFHHPLYSSGNHGSYEGLRMIWEPILDHFKVDIVFNGHDHSYERGYVHNVTYIVTGGGGAPLYDVGVSNWTIYSEKTYHYCLITANQSELDFKAIKPDGTVFDSFQIVK